MRKPIVGFWRVGATAAIFVVGGLSDAFAGEVVTYYLTDPQGSVLATTNALGVMSATSDYRPYGAAALGGTTAGVGYVGHVFDDDSSLVYMQQRYYDPQIGRFLSIDPVAPDGSARANFNRYKYATNNPYKFVDLDGRYDRLVWTSNNTVNVVIPYAISDPNGVARFTSAQVDADITKRLSGSVIVNGVTVAVIAVPVNVSLDSPEVASGKANVINVDPAVTRSSTNKIGGDKIALNANALPGEVSHEITHTAGGGDQYPGGVDVSGHWIPASSPASVGTLMGDMQGVANPQTLKEVVTSPTAEVHCLSGAAAPTGACQ